MTITGNFECSQYFNFETNFPKNEIPFFKKRENSFVVESTTIESITYPCKTTLSEVQWYENLIFSALSAYSHALLIHFLGNFPKVRLVDQRRTQIEVIFYSRCCIMGSVVDILARKTRLTMTVVVQSWITIYNLDLMVSPSNFNCLD